MSDFTYVPTFTFGDRISRRCLVTEFDSGVKQFRSKWGTSLRRWHLRYIGISEVTYLAIIAFFDTQKGMELSFTWTHPRTAIEYTVRFMQDELEGENVGYDNWNLEFDIEMVK